MAAKPISHVILTDTLALTEMRDGFWLYDKTQGMNLSMRAETSQDAFVAAIKCYQKRLQEVERGYTALKSSVDAFVSQHCECDEDHENE